jgi:hypothetical protein
MLCTAIQYRVDRDDMMPLLPRANVGVELYAGRTKIDSNSGIWDRGKRCMNSYKKVNRENRSKCWASDRFKAHSDKNARSPLLLHRILSFYNRFHSWCCILAGSDCTRPECTQILMHRLHDINRYDLCEAIGIPHIPSFGRQGPMEGRTVMPSRWDCSTSCGRMTGARSTPVPSLPLLRRSSTS